jgi:hypothetical protein
MRETQTGNVLPEHEREKWQTFRTESCRKSKFAGGAWRFGASCQETGRCFLQQTVRFQKARASFEKSGSRFAPARMSWTTGARGAQIRANPLKSWLARIPIRWNRLIEKNTRQLNMLEHVLVGKVDPLFRDML